LAAFARSATASASRSSLVRPVDVERESTAHARRPRIAPDATIEREEAGLITTLVYHRVADYDAWKAAYERVLEGPAAADVRSYEVWRGLDDPNLVILAETYESREAADAAFAHPELPAVLADAGVDRASMQVHYLESVLSGTH
jgi:quinol monooxygenase YgiN